MRNKMKILKEGYIMTQSIYVGGIHLELDGDALKVSGADVMANDFEIYMSLTSLKEAIEKLEKEG